jgi:hypothetical protein
LPTITIRAPNAAAANRRRVSHGNDWGRLWKAGQHAGSNLVSGCAANLVGASRPNFASACKSRSVGPPLLGDCADCRRLVFSAGIARAARLQPTTAKGAVSEEGVGQPCGEGSEALVLERDAVSQEASTKDYRPGLANAPGVDFPGKTCIECRRTKALGDFEKTKTSLDNRTEKCRACLTVVKAMRSGKALHHLVLSVEEAWDEAKTCSSCGKKKEIRDFYRRGPSKDGFFGKCRACLSRTSDARPKTRLVLNIPRSCPYCNLVKLASEFDLNNRAPTGLNSGCKSCIKQMRQDRRSRLKPGGIHRRTKLCTRCGKVKHPSSFGINFESLDGLQRLCLQCRAAATARRRNQ